MGIETRSYGPEATTEERLALLERVSQLEDGIVLFREIPVQSTFSIDLMFDRLESLVADRKRFAYVVDLVDAQRPAPEVRAHLVERLNRIEPRVAHAAMVLGRNPMMRAVARLVAFAIGFHSMGFYSTRSEAVEACRAALR